MNKPSRARRQYSPDEKKMIMRLHDEGFTYTQIAERVRPGVENAWRSIGNIVREEKKKALSPKPPQDTHIVPSAVENDPSIAKASENYVKKSAIFTLPPELRNSMTAMNIMSMLDDEQREIFLAAYEELKNEADDEQITRPEREVLMKAALAHTQYLRAAKMYHQCEHYLMLDMEGALDKEDPKKRWAGRGDAYKKEMETKHKEYMELIESLKLTRKQRLDKIKDTRNTLLDLQQELHRKARQESIVDEIKRINTATKDELYRMSKGEVGPDGQRHPWLIGCFDKILQGHVPEKDRKEDNHDEQRNTDASKGE